MSPVGEGRRHRAVKLDLRALLRVEGSVPLLPSGRGVADGSDG